MVRMTAFPVMASRDSMNLFDSPKRLSVPAAVSLMSAVTSYSPASFSASASTFSYVQ